MIKKLLSHTAIYGLAPQVPKLAGIVTLPIITKYLTDVDFGVYGLITAIMAGLTLISTLGMGVVLSNSFYKSPMQYKWAWRQIYGFLILWMLPYTIFVAGILYLFIPQEAEQNKVWIILLNIAPLLLFGPTNILGMYFFQLSQKPLQVGLRSMTVGLTTVFLNLLFIAYYKMGYMGWFLSISISQIILQASYWVPINLHYKLTPIFNFKKRFIKERLKVSLPTVPHSFGGYLLNSSGKILMGALGVPTSNIGLYNVAATMGNYANQVGTASGQAVAPMLLQHYKKGEEKEVRKMIFVLQILFLGGFFILSLWMKEVFQILIRNTALQKVYPLAIVLIMGYTYRPMYFGANSRLFFYEKTKVLLKVTFIAGGVNVLLNLIFIPIFGYKVVVYTAYICFMYMGYIGFYLKEFKETCTKKYYPLRWLLLTTLLTLLVYYLVELDILIKIGVTIFCIVTTIFCVMKLIKDNVKWTDNKL